MDDPGVIDRSASTIEAPAKINLSLHIVGRRPDGYHLVDGLVAFAGVADHLTIEEASEDRLTIGGPMAGSTPAGDNILTRTLAAARRIAAARHVEIGPLALHLDKHLPVAAGLGGGSADAAALLRWLAVRHPGLRADLRTVAATIGADLPMCVDGVPARVGGIGEIVEALPAMPTLSLVLVNPNVPVETARVFRALQTASNPAPPPVPAAGFRDAVELLGYLALCRNDLEPPARRLAPVVGEIVDGLGATDARLVRMSGSGGTVFAVYDSEARAVAAAAAIAGEHRGWWICPTRSRGTNEARQ